METIIDNRQIVELRGNLANSTLGTYQNAIRSLNKFMGWGDDKCSDPVTIFYDRMNKHAMEIYTKACGDPGWRQCKDSPIVFARGVSAFVTIMKRYDDNEDNKHVRCQDFITLISKITDRTPPPNPVPVPRIKIKVSQRSPASSASSESSEVEVEEPEPVPEVLSETSWEVVKPRLDRLSDENTTNGRIALIYSHGYVLRIAEMYKTKFVDDPNYNYLNTETGEWTVRFYKGDRAHLGPELRRPVKSFKINDYLRSVLKHYYDTDGNPFLLHKANGKPYRLDRMTKTWLLPNCQTLRRSYESWNVNKSGRSRDEIWEWHRILGHKPSTVAKYYNRPDEFYSEESESEPDSDTEPEPEPAPKPKLEVKHEPIDMIMKIIDMIKDPVNKVSDYSFTCNNGDIVLSIKRSA